MKFNMLIFSFVVCASCAWSGKSLSLQGHKDILLYGPLIIFDGAKGDAYALMFIEMGYRFRKLRSMAITSAFLWPLAQGNITFTVMWVD